MGGPGSGNFCHWHRPSKKDVVEDCVVIDANVLMRRGVLRANVQISGSVTWNRSDGASFTGNIDVDTLDQRTARLHLIVESVGECIWLATTRPRFGGLRWWFLCPQTTDGKPCERRVGKLYLPPGARSFGCRRCHRLTYTSCQESHRYDSLFRRLARDLGWEPETVKETVERITCKKARGGSGT
jgi:hypothetical protein